jgi:hypothetical protein
VSVCAALKAAKVPGVHATVGDDHGIRSHIDCRFVRTTSMFCAY